MTSIRHSSSPDDTRKQPMTDKITSRIGIPPLLVAVLFVVLASWLGAQQSPDSNQVFQQPWLLKHISADTAKRSLLQLLPQEVADSVLIQVNSATNEINLVGNAQVVQSVGQKLKEIDKPGGAIPYINTATATTPPPLSLNTPNRSQSPLSLNRSDGTTQTTPSATNITFRDPMQNQNFAPPDNPGYIAPEGYEPGTYFCKPSHLAVITRELLARYGHDSNIGLSIIQGSGKILVWAPQSVHYEINALMSQKDAWAEAPAGRDLREFDGSLIRITSQVRPAETSQQPLVERTHTPKYATLDQIEAKLQGLFGQRLSDFSQPDEKLKKFRVAIPRANGMIVCDLVLDYPNYQLSIRAPQNIAEEMLRLLQSIDQQAPEEGYDRQFIAIPNSDPEQIRKLLEICRSKVIHDSSLRTRSNPNMLAYQRNGDPNRQAMRQVNYTTQDEGGLSGLGAAFGQSGGLDGTTGSLGNIPIVPDQWKFQVLPALDVVIIDAPPEEVRRVIDLIAELERLSEFAKSEIEIMPLKHVQCEALDLLFRTQLRISPETGMPVYLYMEMFDTKQGRVWVLPLRNPNAMLIVGWGQARDAMKALIEQLDQPVKEESSLLRVIRLEYAPASEVAPVLTDFFGPPPPVPGQMMAQAGFYPQIRVLHDPRTNTLIIQAAPNDYADIERIVAELDVPKGGPKLQVKTFKMKNLLAADMAAALESALKMAMNGTTDERIPVLEIIVNSEEGKRIIDSGFLDEVTITAVVANNTLVVAARNNCMPLIEELINMIDQSQGEAMVKVIPIKYSDAGTIQTSLTSVFPAEQGGVALPGSADGDIFIPMRFTTDQRSNSIIVAGAQNDIMFIETLIQRLDQPDALQKKVVAYQLRNSDAVAVSQAITNYLEERAKLLSEGVVSQYQVLQDAVIVVPERISNIIIISASDEYMVEIERLIKDLDREPPQVVIQVLIAEVTLSNSREFGIELGLQDPLLFQRSTVSTGEVRPGLDFNNPSLGLGNAGTAESLATSGTVATQMLSNFATGRVNSDSGFGGLIFSASSDAVSVLIRAMQECNRVEILSRPQISAQDNQLAIIFVGQEVTLPGGTTQTLVGSQTETRSDSVGLFVGIVPRISRGETPDEPDKIDMLISASNSTISGDGITIPSGTGSVRIPNINKTRVETIVSALDGETVLLGGLIKTDKQTLNRRVPFLSDIPIAGNLFKYEYERQKRNELIIIMRPRVVRKSEDMDAIKRVEFARMNWTLADVTRLHGDIGVYNPMARQPVTGGAPSFTPQPVDMSQLRDLPLPQRMDSSDTSYQSPANLPTNTLPSTPTHTLPGMLPNTPPGGSFEPTVPQPSTLPPPALQSPTGYSPAYFSR